MDEMQSIDEVLNAPEHKNSFFAIMRNGECVAVMITPDLFEELKLLRSRVKSLEIEVEDLEYAGMGEDL